MSWTGAYTGFVGHRLTVVRRDGTNLSITNLDVPAGQISGIEPMLLPVSDKKVLCVTYGGGGNNSCYSAFVHWDGQNLSIDPFTPINFASNETEDYETFTTTKDGKYLVCRTTLSGILRVVIFRITNTGVESIPASVMTLPYASPNGNQFEFIPISGSELIVHIQGSFEDTNYLRQILIDEDGNGTLGLERTYTLTSPNQQTQRPVLHVPKTRALLICEFHKAPAIHNLSIRVIDIDTGTQGTALLLPYADAEFLVTSGSVTDVVPLRVNLAEVNNGVLLLAYTRQWGTSRVYMELVVQPVAINGTTITTQGEPRPIAPNPISNREYNVDGKERSRPDLAHIGQGVIVTARQQVARTDHQADMHLYLRDRYAEVPAGAFDQNGNDVDKYLLNNRQIVAQALGYLDGTGATVVQDYVPYDNPSQLGDPTSIVTLHVDTVIPNLTGEFRESKVLFSPV